AATTTNKKAKNNVYNIALGDRTSLNELYALLQVYLLKKNNFLHEKLNYRDFREGDVKHSQADISKAKKLLGYRPTHRVNAGIAETLNWHLERS
ncbi:LPS biosynthesis protein WbpP, partial [Gammaproteobacteria bacterium]|nr:LPS biosynthesis protein WbpP [Gammaproteobacteria bacterium]